MSGVDKSTMFRNCSIFGENHPMAVGELLLLLLSLSSSQHRRRRLQSNSLAAGYLFSPPRKRALGGGEGIGRRGKEEESHLGPCPAHLHTHPPSLLAFSAEAASKELRQLESQGRQRWSAWMACRLMRK